MKKWMVLFSLITLLMGSSVWAEDARKIAVLPFSVADTENMDYLRNGILDMLASRLNVEGKLEVLDKADVQDVLDQIRKKGLNPVRYLRPWEEAGSRLRCLGKYLQECRYHSH